MMDLQDYIKPELLVLIPVLFLVGMGLKKGHIPDKWIPFLLGGTGILLSTLYVLSTSRFAGGQDVAAAVFTAVTQGILSAGSSVYVHQLVHQSKKEE